MAGGRADADAQNTRIRAVDDGAPSTSVDYRAWQPLAFDELMPVDAPHVRRACPARAGPGGRPPAGAGRSRARAHARAGEAVPAYLDRCLGPLAAPYFDLHPRRWRRAADAPARPFVALRVYRERWNQEERRRDPARVDRTLLALRVTAASERPRSGARRAGSASGSHPETAADLAAARVVLALQALWILLSRDIPALSALPAEFWTDVPPSARWRYLIWEGHAGLERAVRGGGDRRAGGRAAGRARARLLRGRPGLLLYHLAPLETLFFTPSPWAKGLTIAGAGPDRARRLALRRGAGPAPRAAGGAARGVGVRLGPAPGCSSSSRQPYLFSGWAKLLNAGLGLGLGGQHPRLAAAVQPGRPARRLHARRVCGSPTARRCALLMGAAALAFDLLLRPGRVLAALAAGAGAGRRSLFHAGDPGHAELRVPVHAAAAGVRGLGRDPQRVDQRCASCRGPISSRLSPSSAQRTPTSFTRRPGRRARRSTSTSNM